MGNCRYWVCVFYGKKGKTDLTPETLEKTQGFKEMKAKNIRDILLFLIEFHRGQAKLKPSWQEVISPLEGSIEVGERTSEATFNQQHCFQLGLGTTMCPAPGAGPQVCLTTTIDLIWFRDLHKIPLISAAPPSGTDKKPQ